MERSQPEDQNLHEVLREESHQLKFQENPIDSNKKTLLYLQTQLPWFGTLSPIVLLLYSIFEGPQGKYYPPYPKEGRDDF